MELLQKIKEAGLTYTSYKEKMKLIIENTDPEALNELDKEHLGFTKLNQHRMNRVEKTYEPSAEMKRLVESITAPQIWMILSAVWCGDSAQNVPAIVKMASLNRLIEIKLLERDEHLDIMDQFLSNGSRSIPKLVAFDTAGEILFEWGSRPAEAQKIVTELKGQGIPKAVWEEKLHLFYAKNRSKALEAEMIEKLQEVVAAETISE